MLKSEQRAHSVNPRHLLVFAVDRRPDAFIIAVHIQAWPLVRPGLSPADLCPQHLDDPICDRRRAAA